MRLSLIFYTLVMAGVTYLLRAAPILIFQKKIENPFIQSFLFYVPYAVLAAMTFPAILTSTRCWPSAIEGPVDRCAGSLRGGLCRRTDRTLTKQNKKNALTIEDPGAVFI